MRIGFVVMAALAGCSAGGGTVLEILGSVPASGPPCVFASTVPTTASTTLFDPTGGEDFVLGLVVKNNASESTSDSAQTGSTEFKTKVNTVTVQTIEACFFDGSDAANMEATDCETVSAGQQRVIPATGSIAPDGGASAIAITLMGLTELQQLFTADFLPQSIPIRGAYIEDTNGDGDTDDVEDRMLYSYAAEDRSPLDVCEDLLAGEEGTPCRHDAWGQYPNTGVVSVAWRLRVRGEFQSGSKVESGWRTLTIELCPHCLNARCGMFEGTFCLEGCGGEACPMEANATSEATRRCRLVSDASCTTTCADPPIACFPFGFPKKRPDLSATCLPYQLQSAITCEEFDECVAVPE